MTQQFYLWYKHKRKEKIWPHKNLSINVCNNIHNNSKVETTQISLSTSEWINNPDAHYQLLKEVHLYNRNKKGEGIADTLQGR